MVTVKTSFDLRNGFMKKFLLSITTQDTLVAEKALPSSEGKFDGKVNLEPALFYEAMVKKWL